MDQKLLNNKLHESIKKGSLIDVKITVGIGADIYDVPRNGMNAMAYAAFLGHLDILKYLIEEEHADISNLNLLHLAAMNGGALDRGEKLAKDRGLSIVKYLIEEKGFDVDEMDEQSTPLFTAISNNNVEVVKYLVDHGADIETENNITLNTPLQEAQESGFKDIVKYLVLAGVPIDLEILASYPEESILNIHKKMKMKDKWISAFSYIIREQDNCGASYFKKYVLEFLENTKTEMPDNIRIILSTLI